MIYTNLLDTLQTQNWTMAQDQVLLEPYNYLLHSPTPSKEIRTRLIDAFNTWLDVPEAELEIVRKVVRMLHTGSLLMDDVEDDSQLRRGIPVAHKVYGIPQTINTANYVYFLAYQELFAFRRSSASGSSGPGSGSGFGSEAGGGEGKAKGKGKEKEVALDEMITEELLNLHRGQGMDLFWRDTLTCPTEEEYVQMVLGKTGGLFRIATKLMMARSGSDVDYLPVTNLISLFFQIRDDYQNLLPAESGGYGENKGFAEDLTEGKFSFLVVHAVRREMEAKEIGGEVVGGRRELLNILQKRTDSHPLKQRAVDIMRHRTRSFAYTRKVMKQLEKQVLAEIERLGGNMGLVAIVRALSVELEDGDEEAV